jgi:hypothetical protein
MPAEKGLLSHETGPAADADGAIDVRDHFARNGLDWGVGDLIVAGGSLKLLGEFLACVLNVRDQDQKRAVRCIVLVQPAGTGDVKEVLSAIGEAIGRWRGEPPTADEEAILSRALRVVSPASLEIESVLAAIRDAEPRSTIVIRFASGYRAPDLRRSGTPDRLALPEDFWTPHLHALCVKSLEAIRDRELYVAIEAQEEWPIKPVNRDLLTSVEGMGVLGGGVSGTPAQFLAGRLDAWAGAIATGELGPVLREIEALPSNYDDFKPLWRLQLLRKSKLDGFARQALGSMSPQLARKRPIEGVVVAEIALELDEAETAARFLREIDPESLTSEFLETLLRLSSKLGVEDVASRAEQLLETRFPGSPGLASHRVAGALASLDYRKAADLCARAGSGAWAERAALYARLAELLDRDDPDFDASFEETRSLAPSNAGLAARVIAEHALRRGRFDVILSIALSEEKHASSIDEDLARLVLRALRESLLADGEAVSQEMLISAVSAVLKVVAMTPNDGALRNLLALTLSTESMGLRGLALLLSITLELVRQPQEAEPLQDFRSWAQPASREAVFAYLRPVMAWMAQASPVMIGRVMLPERFVPSESDALIMRLVHELQDFTPIDTETGSETFTQLLGCAMALAPHGSIKDMDLSMLRVAAVRMALAGGHQKARDFAETALLLSGNVPWRARVAWHCHGDVYARTNNLHEALIASACGLLASRRATPDHIFYESMLLFRIARDLKMTDHAVAFLDAGRQALTQFGALDKYKCQLDRSTLQLRVLGLSKREVDVNLEALPNLIADLVANAGDVLSGNMEAAPVAIMLGQVIREASLAGLDVPQKALDAMTELAKRCHPSLRPMLEAASQATPKAADTLTLGRTLEAARHPEDLAFDIRQLTVLARRLLSGDEAATEPAAAVFAIELLSDLTIVPPGADGPRIPKSVELPLAQAAKLAREAALPVVFLGLDSEESLLRVTIEPNGTVSPPVREADTVFSGDRFYKWVEEFPYRYGVDDKSFNLFFTSTEQIGVGDLPKRAAIIASTSIQRIPPNIIRIGDRFAGDDRRLFSAPSMAWLEAARASQAGDGRPAAWISTEALPEGSQTLQTIADRLRGTLDDFGISLDEEATVPSALAGAELAIVAAHGGLLPGGFYFHVIGNDAEFKAAAARLADAVRGAGVAVLFVCSGGRIDSHPMANTTIGLVKYALEAGCRTVVASPWPLDSRVPSYWLPAFLDAWHKGSTVVDAAYEANQAIKSRFVSEQRDYLAMNVYGDGLRVRGT